MMRRAKAVKSLRAGLKARFPRLSILFWAVFISALCGAVQFWQPVEEVLQAGRDYVRRHDAPQDIVVVGTDEQTVKELGGLDFPRRYHAEALDILFARGARRVFFDQAFADPSNPLDDAAFAAALKRHSGQVFLGSMRVKNRRMGTYEAIRPRAEFRQYAGTMALSGKISPFGLTAKLPYSITLANEIIPSMSVVLAGQRTSSQAYYRPDWSTRMSTIPTVRFVDLVKRRAVPIDVAGKDIVIGATVGSFEDLHYILGQGWVPGVYFHVVGAGSLKRGALQDWGFLPFFVFSFVASVAFLTLSRRTQGMTIGVAAMLVFAIVPFMCDARRIVVEVIPGLMMFLIVIYRTIVMRKLRASSETNLISGLPNFAALRETTARYAATLVALKIRNHAEIASSFDQVVERAMIEEIRRRIVLSGDGGDMFHSEDTLLWFTPLPMAQELAHHLEGLKAILSSALPIGEREIDVSVAFGVDADHERPLASRIGSAMLCAEEAARANDIWKFYDPQRRHEAAWQLSLLSRLDQAIDTGEVWVAYQSQLDLRTRTITGAEALVRWTHPERGLIGPDEFIAVAEKHNRIEKLTSFVLDHAVATAAKINAQGVDFSISVNLSVQLLQMPDLMEMISEILDRHYLPAEKLILEITETGRLDRHGPSIAMMGLLSEYGIRVSIDDYGTGNATLDYLKLLPCDEVKIDRQFVSGIDTNAQDRILVGSTIDMVHSLGRKVVAEGVETDAVLQVLAGLGCDSAQGFLIGRPIAVDAFERSVLGKGRRTAQI